MSDSSNLLPGLEGSSPSEGSTSPSLIGRRISCTQCGHAFLISSRRDRRKTCSDACHDKAELGRYLRRTYKITGAKHEQMMSDQRGRCAICGKRSSSGRRLAVDHDHRTGEVRGLLCFKCNVGIGSFNDDTSLLRAASVYLTRGKRKVP